MNERACGHRGGLSRRVQRVVWQRQPAPAGGLPEYRTAPIHALDRHVGLALEGHAQRLLTALNRALEQTVGPQSIEDLRKDIGLDHAG